MYRQMSEQGDGAWFGAFFGDRVVGDLGVFVRNGLGRFQSVGTHPDFRRQGICSTLVYQAALYAFSNFDAKILVIAADQNDYAYRIYESIGFSLTEQQVWLTWWEQN